MAKLEAKYQFFPDRGERGEWVGVVYEKGWFRTTVVTVGCMATEQGIKLWLAAYLRTGVEPADMHGGAA